LKTIWKYEFLVAENIYEFLVAENIIEVPIEGEILSVQNQNNKIVLWMKINTKNKIEKRRFIIFGTGQNIDTFSENIIYIGTVQMSTLLVWHVFERLG